MLPLRAFRSVRSVAFPQCQPALVKIRRALPEPCRQTVSRATSNIFVPSPGGIAPTPPGSWNTVMRRYSPPPALFDPSSPTHPFAPPPSLPPASQRLPILRFGQKLCPARHRRRNNFRTRVIALGLRCDAVPQLGGLRPHGLLVGWRDGKDIFVKGFRCVVEQTAYFS